MAAIAERLFQVGEEIQHIENDLRHRRMLLRAFLGHLRPANPAIVGDRIRAANQKIMDLERRLQMLRDEQQSLIVQAVLLGDQESPPEIGLCFRQGVARQYQVLISVIRGSEDQFDISFKRE